MKIGYVDCFSGISGDMFLGALIDAGLSIEHLRSELAKLGIQEAYSIGFQAVMKGAINAGLFGVEIEGVEAGAPSATAGSHGHVHPHPHTHGHSLVLTAHSHENPGPELHAGHDHAHEHHVHEHQRTMRDIAAMIEASGLSPQVKSTSLAIFRKLAEAEGKIHGEPPDEVGFHEVGAVDSILDIVGAAVGLEALGIERLYSSAVPLGSGKVNTQHGLLPLPAPATLELFRQAQIPVVASPAEKELVTPTGAAILATLATFEQPAMRILAVGTGAGRRELAWPNILRVVIGETSEGSHGELVLMETNIDDMNAQGFGQVMARLFAAGALDVFFTPIFMKKNRPATMLSIITSRLHEPALARILLEETTTFGMRIQPIGRYEAQREMRKVQTGYGEIDVKLKKLDGKVIQAIPEYDTCLRLAEESGAAFWDVYQSALAAGRSLVEK